MEKEQLQTGISSDGISSDEIEGGRGTGEAAISSRVEGVTETVLVFSEGLDDGSP